MVTHTELQEQRNQVEFLRLQLAERHLVKKLDEKDTPIDGADIIARQGQELLRLNKAHNKVLGKVRARDTEIERLERSNCEFRAKIVELHTEIQDLRDRIALDDDCSREESPEEHNCVEVKVAFLELP